MSSKEAPFTFVDLFAGIGGFHAALSAFGGDCVYAVEKDPEAAKVYELNWGMPALGDIVEDTEEEMKVPPHDVLAAGFPCQPFSKSGFQRGMDETRGTLFFNHDWVCDPECQGIASRVIVEPPRADTPPRSDEEVILNIVICEVGLGGIAHP